MKRKLFWKEVGEVNNGRKVEKCSRIKDRTGRLKEGEEDVQEGSEKSGRILR